VRLGWVILCEVMLGYGMLGEFRLCFVRLGYVSLGL